MCHFEPLRGEITSLNGTEGRSRTDTVSPPPDFESGASTNSATPAQALIITKNDSDTMGKLKINVKIYLLSCILSTSNNNSLCVV